MTQSNKDNILVIEDDAEMRGLISRFLRKKGFVVEEVATGDDAFEVLNNYRAKVIVADLNLKNSTITGVTMIEMLKKKVPNTAIIVISGYNLKMTFNLHDIGVYDLLEKPFNNYKLYISVLRACESYHMLEENNMLKHKKTLVNQYVGESPAAVKVHRFIYRSIKKVVRVGLFGSRGRGKEVIARTIHNLSELKSGTFEKYIADGYDNDIYDTFFLDSYNKSSLMMRAQGGTLFIDNICDIPLKVQHELAKILNDNYYKNDKNNSFQELNVNIIVASLEDPIKLVSKGLMSQELYLILSSNTFEAPCIVEMKDDFPLFIKKITQEIVSECGVPVRIFSSEAIAFLQLYKWQGGFRELKAIVERVLVYSGEEGPVTSQELLSFIKIESEYEHVQPKETPQDFDTKVDFSLQIDLAKFSRSSLKEVRTYCEMKFIKMQMMRFNKNISKTAYAIEMERSALHRKLKSLGIDT